MKSKFFIICLMMAMMPFSNVNAIAIPVDLEAAYIDPDEGQENPQRTPITCPNLSIEVHTLYFNNVGYDLTLVLVDEENEVAYTTLIPAHTSSIILPHYLDGDYKIELFPGGEYYGIMGTGF